jgi:hypothetical protein
MNRTIGLSLCLCSVLAHCGRDESESIGGGGAGAGRDTSTGAGGESTVGPGGAAACASVDACTACELSACPERYCPCYGDPECVSLAACTATCSERDPACLQACWSAHPSAIATGALLVDCAAKDCAAECPGYQPIGACLECLYGGCPSEMNACISVVECTDLFVCLGACTTPTCQSACYQQHPDGTGPIGPVGNCLQERCATACAP